MATKKKAKSTETAPAAKASKKLTEKAKSDRASGTPEAIAAAPGSHTGRFLARRLGLAELAAPVAAEVVAGGPAPKARRGKATKVSKGKAAKPAVRAGDGDDA